MLYLSTRNSHDAFTAYRTLCSDCAPDNGAYIPLTMPTFNADEILSLQNKPFGNIIADILNQFFSAKLTSWDVEFAIGRNPSKLSVMSQKTVIAELWHSPEGCFNSFVKALYARLNDNNVIPQEPTEWVKTAVRISVIFALYGQLLSEGILNADETYDISVCLNDFTTLSAASYAKDMGLPIGSIICTCADSDFMWDIIHRGVFPAVDTNTETRLGIERLLASALGEAAVNTMVEKHGGNRSFTLSEEEQPQFKREMFCAVIGKPRAASTINSIYRSNCYIIDPIAALSYSGLQDYRSKSGENRITLLLSESSPLRHVAEISNATGLATETLQQLVNSNKQGNK